MAAINTIATNPVLSQAYAAEQANQATAQQAAGSENSGGTFGNAVNVTLSAPAQAVLAGQGASSSSGSSSASLPPPPAPSSPGVPVASSTTTTDAEELIQEALQQVIPKVGVARASEVVDSKGTIDQVKLQQLVEQQSQPKAS